jgi:DNA-binding NarL/FixJ family response regulator
VIRLVVADDQELIRSGLRTVLEADGGFDVVGEAPDGAHAVQEVERLQPDVALVDIRMPEMDGIEATRRIAQRAPSTRVLILTTYDLDEYVYAALAAGASGFLLKSVPTPQLVQGIRVVVEGAALLAPSLTKRLVERHLAAPAGVAPAALRGLTEREREVLTQIARGLSNAEIAAELFVSEATVKTHVNHLLGKLRLRDRVQAVVLAYECGLVRPGGYRPRPSHPRGVVQRSCGKRAKPRSVEPQVAPASIASTAR